MTNYPDLKIDITNCDSEPIHLIGNVQAHTGLIIADLPTLTIEQLSENINRFVKTESSILGKSVSDFIELPENYSTYSADQKYLKETPDYFQFLFAFEDKLYLEFEEKRTAIAPLPTEVIALIAGKLNAQQTIEEASDLVAENVRELTGYDRVMIYRFDEDWHGEVVGESVLPGVDSYRHHHFPATDIPVQARQMLIRKKIRQIADVNSQPIAIQPYHNPGSGKPVNMELSDIRQPSDIHLQFLRNMKVGATLSASIMVKDQLWGIIALQNESPLLIDYHRRRALEAIAGQLGLFIASWKEELNISSFLNYTQNAAGFITSIRKEKNIRKAAGFHTNDLLQLTSASGFATRINGEILTEGKTPDNETIQSIVDSLRTELAEKPIISSRNLKKLSGNEHFDSKKAAGILAFQTAGQNSDYFIWFREEMPFERIWAGKPDANKTKGDLQSLHPRNSFEQWVELVKNTSLPWSRAEVEAVREFRRDFIKAKLNLQNQILGTSLNELKELHEELKHTHSKLEMVNKELESFAYTVSHDLRSPLTNISRLSDFLAMDYGSTLNEEGKKLLSMIKEQVIKMNKFINELLDSSRAGKTKIEEIDPGSEIRGVLEKLHVPDHIEITIGHLPGKIMYSPRHFSQIMQNYIDNAIKYNDKAEGQILIDAIEKETEWIFSVKDNGAGIRKEMLPEIFEPYVTAHGSKRSDSTGVGLFIVKQTAEKHEGRVWVESQEGQGSVFYLSVPK